MGHLGVVLYEYLGEEYPEVCSYGDISVRISTFAKGYAVLGAGVDSRCVEVYL